MSAGYLDRHPRHARTLAGVFAIHAGVLALILTTKPSLIIPQAPHDPIELIPIRKFPPPPQPRVQPQSHPSADTHPQDPHPTEPVPSADTTAHTIDGPTTTFFPQTPLPPMDPGPPIIETPRTIASAPVITEAGIDPRWSRDLQPPYPPAMERLEQEGTVTVRVQIGSDGRVTDVEKVRADADDFFVATKAWALRKWRFRPATRDGVPVVGWLTKTVRFQISR